MPPSTRSWSAEHRRRAAICAFEGGFVVWPGTRQSSWSVDMARHRGAFDEPGQKCPYELRASTTLTGSPQQPHGMVTLIEIDVLQVDLGHPVGLELAPLSRYAVSGDRRVTSTLASRIVFERCLDNGPGGRQ